MSIQRFLLVVAAGTVAACAGGQPAPPAPAGPSVNEYAPLAVGNEWTYDVRFPGQSGQRTVRIREQDEEGYYLDDAGGAFKVTETGLRDRARYLIRAPMEVGREWNAVVSASAVEHYEIESFGAPCGAKAGRFEDCLVVVSRLRRDKKVTLHVRFVWARGVGLVKVETSADIDGKGMVKQTEQSLLRYRVGGGAPVGPAAGSEPKTDDEAAPDTWER